MKKDKQSNCGTDAAYPGSGKLSDYKKDGSWMMNQINKGWQNVERGITVNKKDNENIRFAKIASKIVKASKEFKIVKKYKQLESNSKEFYRFALKWNIYGQLNGSTLRDLKAVQELLCNEVQTDYQKMIFALNANYEYIGDGTIDFNNNSIKVESIISFKIDAKINTEKIISFLNKLEFEQIEKAM